MSLKEIKTKTKHYFEDEFGNKHGEYKWWYENGQLRVHCFFVDDKVHGEYKWWYSDGQLREHCYIVDGKQHGEYKEWHSDGQLSRHCFYVDDKVVIDFMKEPDEYPTSDEDKTYLVLKYGWFKWLPNN
jgi:antitoxin component YwqK of YwqJK toxin-antitoxin module